MEQHFPEFQEKRTTKAGVMKFSEDNFLLGISVPFDFSVGFLVEWFAF